MNYSFWHNRRVLITGHTGFKGSWLCLWLNLLGAKVYGYALDPPTDPNLFELAEIDEIVTGSIGDIDCLSQLTNIIESSSPEFIIHMAAQSVVLDSYEDPISTYATNVMGTVHLLEAVRQTGISTTIVNVTTDKCYENIGVESGYKESDKLGGRDPYSNSKACSELVSAAYRESYFPPDEFVKHGVALATARAGNVVGGGDWTPWQLIPEVMNSFSRGEKVVLRHPGAIRPWQHVLDCLSGYLLLAEKLSLNPADFSGAWNFGPADKDNHSVADVVDILALHSGIENPWICDTKEHSHEEATLNLDSSKANEYLAWKPRLSIDMALSWVVEWNKDYKGSESVRELCHRQIKDYMSL